MSVMWLFLTVSWVGLQFVILVFPDHTQLLLDKTVKIHDGNAKYNKLITIACVMCTHVKVELFKKLNHWRTRQFIHLIL